MSLDAWLFKKSRCRFCKVDCVCFMLMRILFFFRSGVAVCGTPVVELSAVSRFLSLVPGILPSTNSFRSLCSLSAVSTVLILAVESWVSWALSGRMSSCDWVNWPSPSIPVLIVLVYSFLSRRLLSMLRWRASRPEPYRGCVSSEDIVIVSRFVGSCDAPRKRSSSDRFFFSAAEMHGGKKLVRVLPSTEL